MNIWARAHAKINWSLDILAARDDGYHELDMLMQRIALHDELTFSKARFLTLTINGRQVPAAGKNLVLKAAKALNEYAGTNNGARIEMVKRIPVRAGLGGGSADCAVALMALNRLWGINLNAKSLMQLAAKLGADVPFCMEGRFAHVHGIGDRMEHMRGAPRIPLVLIMPSEGLSTAGIFGAYDSMGLAPLGLDIPALADALRKLDFAACRALAGNSLEAPAIRQLPEVQTHIHRLYENGAAFAHMTGSGSCVFGAFRSDDEARRAVQNMGMGIFTHTLGDK